MIIFRFNSPPNGGTSLTDGICVVLGYNNNMLYEYLFFNKIDKKMYINKVNRKIYNIGSWQFFIWDTKYNIFYTLLLWDLFKREILGKICYLDKNINIRKIIIDKTALGQFVPKYWNSLYNIKEKTFSDFVKNKVGECMLKKTISKIKSAL